MSPLLCHRVSCFWNICEYSLVTKEVRGVEMRKGDLILKKSGDECFIICQPIFAAILHSLQSL